jgi:hypothetical protein
MKVGRLRTTSTGIMLGWLAWHGGPTQHARATWEKKLGQRAQALRGDETDRRTRVKEFIRIKLNSDFGS